MQTLLQRIQKALASEDFRGAELLLQQIPSALNDLPYDEQEPAAMTALNELQSCRELALIHRSQLEAQWRELAIAERYAPQDTRFSTNTGGRKWEV